MKINTAAIGDIVKDLFAGLLDLGESALADAAAAAAAKIDAFLVEHSDSPNFNMLADHAATQIVQESALAALRLEREAVARVRVGIVAVLRALVAGSR